jgi:hypothetical protein
MNLQEFKNQHKEFTIRPCKKLFFDKYPVKLKIRWDGCTFLNGRAHRFYDRRVPDWVKNDPKIIPANITKIKLRGRMIELDPAEFHAMYKFLEKNPPIHCRFDDSYSRGTMHFYFMSVSEANEWLQKAPTSVRSDFPEIYAPFQDLSVGELIANPKITAKGYKYRINFKSFRLDLGDRKKYAQLLSNLGNDIKVPTSFDHVLNGDWGANRTVWYLSNKYVYTKDQSSMTYLTLALPNMIHSVQDLVSKKEISWQK